MSAPGIIECRTSRIFSLICAMVFVVGGCGGGGSYTPPPPPVTLQTINVTPANLKKRAITGRKRDRAPMHEGDCRRP